MELWQFRLPHFASVSEETLKAADLFYKKVNVETIHILLEANFQISNMVGYLLKVAFVIIVIAKVRVSTIRSAFIVTIIVWAML